MSYKTELQSNNTDLQAILDMILALGLVDAPKLITFYLNGVECQALEGMTPSEWADSEYNTIGVYWAPSSEELRDENGVMISTPNGEWEPIIEGDEWYSYNSQFSIDGTCYFLQEGWTWRQWCDTSFNTIGARATDSGLYSDNYSSFIVDENNNRLSIDDVIIAEYNYQFWLP